MRPESFPGGTPEDQPAELDYEGLNERTGLGPQELDQVVEYEKPDGGVIRGTIGQMLSDQECPVGMWVAQAYQHPEKGGVEASHKKLNQVMMVADQPPVELSEQTRSYHNGAISREELLRPVKKEVQEGFLGINALRNRLPGTSGP